MQTIEAIKLSVVETAKEVRNLKLDNRPHVSASYSELGCNVLSNLKQARLFSHFHGEDGSPSIMTDEDICLMAAMANEYESNCYVQCKLISVFNEIGLSVVNSERPGFEWLQTLKNESKLDKRPDMIICNACFYDLRYQPNIGDRLLTIQNQLLRSDDSLLYGIKTGHPLQFLDDIFIVEGKKDKITDSDVGQAKTYAGLQARFTNNPVFHRILLFDREKFIMFMSKGGDFVSGTECNWNKPGSTALMQIFFDVPSPLVKALAASCDALSVTPCTPQVHRPCILGAGGNGVVFRVNSTVCIEDCHSIIASETSCKALKVVVGNYTAVHRLHREWENMKRAKPFSDRVVSVGPIHIGDGFGAYLIDQVGCAVEIDTVEQKKTLFISLFDLHLCGVVHGDARLQNAILMPDGIMWIDFVDGLFSCDKSVLFENDFLMLFESVFGVKPSILSIGIYTQCISDRVISTPSWEILFAS
jgi:hypothetical protein